MRRKRERLSTTPVRAYIEKLSHDGRGIAKIDGKVTFVDGALPQEEVLLQYTRKKRDFDEGRVCAVEVSSPLRVEPHCPHYHICGGCSMQHMDAKTQIQIKEDQLLDVLSRVGQCTPASILPPLGKDIWHYRNKARLSVRYVEKKQSTLIGFREKHNPRYIAEISECPVLHAKVDQHIKELRQLLDSMQDPHTIAQIEVAAGDEKVALIFRHLNALSLPDQEKLRAFSLQTGFVIFLQAAGPDSVQLFYPEEDDAFLTYRLPEEDIQFKFFPTDFTQVNMSLNPLMIRQALQLLALTADDAVLDLFCGLGNFSLPMAKYAHCVLGIEGSEAMVRRALMNAKANHIHNADFIYANLDEEHVLDKLQLNRRFDKVLLDPPRTGALSVVSDINKISPDRIVYVSCNPATLARDAGILVNHHGYRLITAGVMDMFPQTSHVESIALFEKG